MCGISSKDSEDSYIVLQAISLRFTFASLAPLFEQKPFLFSALMQTCSVGLFICECVFRRQSLYSFSCLLPFSNFCFHSLETQYHSPVVHLQTTLWVRGSIFHYSPNAPLENHCKFGGQRLKSTQLVLPLYMKYLSRGLRCYSCCQRKMHNPPPMIKYMIIYSPCLHTTKFRP